MNIREAITLLEDAELNNDTRRYLILTLAKKFPKGSEERTRLMNYGNAVGDETPERIARKYLELADLHKDKDEVPDSDDTRISPEGTEEIWDKIKDMRDELDDGDKRTDLSNIMNSINKSTTPESVAEIWLNIAGDRVNDDNSQDDSGNSGSDNDDAYELPTITVNRDDDKDSQRDQPTRPGQDRSGPQRDRPTRPGQDRSGPTLSKIRQTLRRGNRGQAVKIAQQALGIPADGIFGPQTQRAVKQFQQRNGLQVDGIIGQQTLAALKNKNRTGKVGNVDTAPGRVSAAPQSSRRPQQKPTQNSSKINSSPVLAEGNNNMSNISRILQLAGTNKKPLNESQSLEECPPMDSAAMPTGEGSPVTMNVNLSASGKDHVNDLLSMMKAAGLDSAEPVSAKSISQIPDMDPSTMQDPESSMSDPEEPEMGDYIRMISQEAEDDGGFEDATTEPDEDYSDIRASIPSGDDLSRSKKPYPPTDGGDNPMALEQKLKSKLAAALAEKKAKPDYIDIDGDGDTKEPMKKAAKDKKKKSKVDN